MLLWSLRFGNISPLEDLFLLRSIYSSVYALGIKTTDHVVLLLEVLTIKIPAAQIRCLVFHSIACHKNVDAWSHAL